MKIDLSTKTPQESLSRKRFQPAKFGLKVLLIALLFASILFAWFAAKLNQMRREANLIGQIETLNEDVTFFVYKFDYQTDKSLPNGEAPIAYGPSWLRSLFGQHVFSRVTELSITGKAFIKPRNYRDASTLLPDNSRSLTLDSIKELDLTEFSKLESVTLTELHDLEDLAVLDGLSKVKHLNVHACSELDSLAGLEKFKQLESLQLTAVDGRKISSTDNWNVISAMPNIRRLHIACGRGKYRASRKSRSSTRARETEKRNRVTKFKVAPFLPNANIEALTLKNIDFGLEGLASFKEMPALKSLNISSVPLLMTLDGLESCIELENLSIEKCQNLNDISAIQNLSKLKNLRITYSDCEVTLPSLNIPYLETLDFSGMHGPRNLKFLAGSEQLKSINFRDGTLRSLEGLSRLSALKDLKVSGSELETIGCKSEIQSGITRLDLSNCDLMVSLQGIEHFKTLKSLNLQGCLSLEDLNGVGQLIDLESLDLSLCASLTDLNEAAKCQNLIQITATGCDQLKRIDRLKSLTNLQFFAWQRCPNLDKESVKKVFETHENLELRPDVRP